MNDAPRWMLCVFGSVCQAIASRCSDLNMASFFVPPFTGSGVPCTSHFSFLKLRTCCVCVWAHFPVVMGSLLPSAVSSLHQYNIFPHQHIVHSRVSYLILFMSRCPENHCSIRPLLPYESSKGTRFYHSTHSGHVRLWSGRNRLGQTASYYW